eukprot:TRINITY_DN25437_c0_g1_i2.p1 TRINITY_DN25437_c0_g1~~TRINITY_DN25437_c0_g1_i2.p1  ORF type:complete len:502 (-),score=89.49 TRINITY_DN25437_c0_g1_i2:90-1469(-)
MGVSSSSRRSSDAQESAAANSAGAGGCEAEPEESLGIGEGLAKGYEELVNAIIRPPRTQYDPAKSLGPAEFRHCGKRFVRQDVELVNSRRLKLQCSWWRFHPDDQPAPTLPCVIYLHGNASCRVAAFELLAHLLPCAVTVFALDFAGSGLSEGQHVSLGYYEREDVEAAIAYLRGTGEVSTVGLWGHSMGATTALLYGDRDPSIAALVLDSPFTDLMELAHELAQNARDKGMLRVPGIAVSATALMVRRSVRRRAGFDPQDVSPIGNCGKCFIPALFAHGEHDAFIRPSHSEQLHAAYAGDKNLILFDGDHNSARPDFFFNSAVIFLRNTLLVREEDCLSPGTGTELRRNAALLQDRRGEVRQAEEEMMRQAMMMSLADGQAASQGAAGGTAAAPAAAAVPQAALEQGVASFETVTGVGGATAQYYVHGALSRGEEVEAAIQLYFDGGCLSAPPGWKLP